MGTIQTWTLFTTTAWNGPLMKAGTTGRWSLESPLWMFSLVTRASTRMPGHWPLHRVMKRSSGLSLNALLLSLKRFEYSLAFFCFIEINFNQIHLQLWWFFFLNFFFQFHVGLQKFAVSSGFKRRWPEIAGG